MLSRHCIIHGKNKVRAAWGQDERTTTHPELGDGFKDPFFSNRDRDSEIGASIARRNPDLLPEPGRRPDNRNEFE